MFFTEGPLLLNGVSMYCGLYQIKGDILYFWSVLSEVEVTTNCGYQEIKGGVGRDYRKHVAQCPDLVWEAKKWAHPGW